MKGFFQLETLINSLFFFLIINVSDVYEGTRSAITADLPGIKRVIQPLEESGVLIKRTDEEVYFLVPFVLFMLVVQVRYPLLSFHNC